MPFDQQEFELLRSFAAPGDAASIPAVNPVDIGAERLRILADLLDRVNPENFDMCLWCNECGTSACAAGWAGTIPAFRLAGYSCDQNGPRFAGQYTFNALRAFFDIDFGESHRLFGSDGHSTAPEVAARIREHLASRSPAIQGGKG